MSREEKAGMRRKSMSDELIAVWTGTFRLFGGDVKCAVLSDGQRVIEADSMAELFERMGSGDHTLDPDELAAFALWQKGQA